MIMDCGVVGGPGWSVAGGKWSRSPLWAFTAPPDYPFFVGIEYFGELYVLY